MDNISKKINILERNQKKMLESLKITTEMENVFDGLITRLTTAKESINKLEDMVTETSQTKRQR